MDVESIHTRKGSLHVGVVGHLKGCSVALLVWEDDFCVLALKLVHEAVLLMVVTIQLRSKLFHHCCQINSYAGVLGARISRCLCM